MTTDPTLIRVFLALLMPAGFALLATGMCRSKNAAHTAFMCFFAPVLAVTGFWICGFALADTNGEGVRLLLHNRQHLLESFSNFIAFLPAVIMATCIPIGALAERWRLKSFYVTGLFLSAVLFPAFARWTWGGGWLASLGTGFTDVAGSGVVHAVGGLCALAGALVIGPRHGRYGKNGAVNPVPAHNVPLALFGSFLLTIGWFAFNIIRSVDGTGEASRLALIATATALAGTGGAVAAAIYMTVKTRRPDPTIVANGLLAGLVASGSSAGLVGPNNAFLIGVVAGLIVCLAVNNLDKLRVDDPVGTISVHGFGGLWGVLATGLLAHGSVRGLVRGGGGGLLVAQLVGIAALIVWAFGASWVFFKVLNRIVPMRVEPEVEISGLDIPETGVPGYPDTERFE